MGSSADLLKEREDKDDEAKRKALREIGKSWRAIRDERRQAAKVGSEALARLVEVCRNKTGQSSTIRQTLYSLWNGAPRSLLNGTLGLDWALKKDLCAVVLAFGFDGDDTEPPLWYDQIKAAFESAGLWDWFLAEAINNEL